MQNFRQQNVMSKFLKVSLQSIRLAKRLFQLLPGFSPGCCSGLLEALNQHSILKRTLLALISISRTSWALAGALFYGFSAGAGKGNSGRVYCFQYLCFLIIVYTVQRNSPFEVVMYKLLGSLPLSLSRGKPSLSFRTCHLSF